MMKSITYAMAAGGTGQPNMLVGFLPLLIIVLAFYFIFIYPQFKQQKKHKNFLSELKSGDKVVTNGGIYVRM